MREVRLLLAACLIGFGILSGIYKWGEWVACAAIAAYAIWHVWWVTNYSRKRPGAFRLVLTAISFSMVGCLPTFIGLVIGTAIHGGNPS